MSKTLDVNATTGEEIIRDMTEQEESDYAKVVAKEKAKQDAENAKETAKAALLAKLGITADEAALLLG
jgi:hypothetical protein